MSFDSDMRPDSTVSAYNAGVKGLAEGAARSVHAAFVLDAFHGKVHEPRKAQIADPYNESNRKTDEYFRSTNGNMQMKLVKDEPAFKAVLPELATNHLLLNFDSIHDNRDGKNMTIDELKEFAARCDGREVDKLSAEYAINNFDKLKAADPSGAGITKDGLMKVFNEFKNMEADLFQQQNVLALAPVLNNLEKNFDAIQPDKSRSITEFDLNKYAGANCDDPAKKVLADALRQNWSPLSNFDAHDGESTISTLWIQKENAAGITRSDVTAGQAKIKEADKARTAIYDRFNYWSK